MEPKLPAPNLNPERAPSQYGQNIESAPLPPNPEIGLERAEKPMEQQGEAVPAAANATPILPTPIAIPVPVTPTTADDASLQDGADAPLLANDDDLIEKEWVDKAKKIIAETKDDPHRREQEVGKLQADYLKKRYGKELGATE
ncbi:MAG: hypothetical protein JWO61_102 [Candidatus Saccharibacteria bacterium]|nr:hypothetical protein [Candidatus Saccharibacteria bacterium]